MVYIIANGGAGEYTITIDVRESFVIRDLSDFDAMIVFGTDPIHPARRVPIFHDFRGHHRGTALRTHMRVRFSLVAKARARCFGNFLWSATTPSATS